MLGAGGSEARREGLASSQQAVPKPTWLTLAGDSVAVPREQRGQSWP